ncbi:hypothetical protein [Mesorhizobium sp. ISC11]|uniref:hypothetical protein n=1 Tax=Mesorhizobium sp. ISC11 TaxID=3076428 RepID=UPI00301D4375
MKVHFRAQYLTSSVGQMRREDYNATLLVHAVKGKPIGSSQYAHVRIGGSSVMITDASKDRAMDWFGEWAAPFVKAQGWAPKVLVPIPNRSAVAGNSAVPRTALIAHAVRRATGGAVVVADVLRWKRQLPKSTDMASRRPEVLLPDLILTGKVPVGTVVLIDDVFTSGGHAIASTWRLADQLKTPSCVISCGRTLHIQLDDPFKVPDEELVIPKRP